jgi:hypothetical protein
VIPTPVRRLEIRRHTWKWVAVCAVIVVAAFWFGFAQLKQRGFDWNLARQSLAGLQWRWLVVSLAPIFGTYYGRALRWAVFLRPVKPHPSISNILVATVIGFTAIALFGRPGEFVRPYLIARKENVPVPSQLAAWVIERIFDLLMALVVFGFALSRVHASGMQVGEKLAWVLTLGGRIVAGSCVGLLALLLSLRHFAEPARCWLLRTLQILPEKRYQQASRLIGAFVQGVESTRSDGALLLVFLYSVMEWILIAACYWCLAKAFRGTISLSVVDVLIYMGFVTFGAAVQIPGIGGGVQVVSMVVLTELFGVRLELASIFSILIWALTFLAIVPFGFVLAFKEGLDWRGLRHLGDEVPK